jgi:hypothetical protein
MKENIIKTISMLLWGLTAVVAGYEIFLIRYIVTQFYFIALEWQKVPITVLEKLSATGVGNVASLGMAIVAIVIVVGGFDFHWKHAGERRSFILLGWTILFQVVILGIDFLV